VTRPYALPNPPPDDAAPGLGLPAGAARAATLLRLPLTLGGRVAAGWGRRLLAADPDAVPAQVRARNAEHLFAVLGQLRGGAMKVGQALSVFETLVPEEIAEPYRETLGRLQSSGTPVPARDVHRVLAEQLGARWPQRFRDFDDVPAAAASLGQVHRAVWANGRAVAVKVQYPGADLALDADLRTLKRFSRLFALVVPGLDARVVGELRDQMLEELDYRAEADRQRAFAAAFAGGDRIVVPAVVAAAPKVLVSEWVDGPTLGALTHHPAVDATDQAVRDRHAHTVVETLLSSPARVGLLHADPHPGNVLLLPDGRLAMVDYGSVAALPGGVPPVLARLLGHVANGEAAPMMRLLRAEGFLDASDAPAPDDVLAYLGVLADPLRVPRFHFDRTWTRRHAARVVRDPAYWHTARALALPPHYLMLVRVLSGWMNVLAQLDCTVAVRDLARHWLPGFAEVTGGAEEASC
jgi:predicted unusual protein kinase regulating ubiquinone biosynthesis (AarF/ABC1/UbiB family)